MIATVLAIVPLCFTSFSKARDSVPDKPVPINLSGDQVLLIGSGNAFAFDLFRNVLQKSCRSVIELEGRKTI